MDVQQNLELFRELMLCDGNIYSWTYDGSGKLLYSNCPSEAIFADAFDIFGCLKKMLDLGERRTSPSFLCSDAGLIWGVAYEKVESVIYRCHVIGPVFHFSVHPDMVYNSLKHADLSRFSVAWLHRFREALELVPISRYSIFSHNLRMLHYCITGKTIKLGDIHLDDIQVISDNRQRTPKDRLKVYHAEQAMLGMVRQGNLNYQEALKNSMMSSDGVDVSTRDPLRSASVSAIVFTTLVCRAAIEGGLNPDDAYSLGDTYIQNALDAHNVGELSNLCINMYDDFVHRVHKRKSAAAYTPPIRRCCDFIEMNVNRNIKAQELADLVGYTVPYFTRLFRKETGVGISDYVKKVRIERAKVLLDTSESSIQEISDSLGFTSRNYFTYSFRDVTGMTPVEYRSRER